MQSGHLWCGIAVKLLVYAAAAPLTRRHANGVGDDLGSSLQDPAFSGQNEVEDYLDELNDESLRQLLLHELGSDRNGVLKTLFGEDTDPEPGESRRGPESYFKLLKRAGNRPQFDPGWRFVGLGKKRQNGFYPRSPKVKDVDKAGSEDLANPYLTYLVLSNLSDFFRELKHELKRPPELTSSLASGGWQQINAEMKTGGKPKLNSPSSGDGVSLLYTRARKPENHWNFKSKTMYDPAWMLTGLGK